jgi:hypothetical protein
MCDFLISFPSCTHHQWGLNLPYQSNHADASKWRKGSSTLPLSAHRAHQSSALSTEEVGNWVCSQCYPRHRPFIVRRTGVSWQCHYAKRTTTEGNGSKWGWERKPYKRLATSHCMNTARPPSGPAGPATRGSQAMVVNGKSQPPKWPLL